MVAKSAGKILCVLPAEYSGPTEYSDFDANDLCEAIIEVRRKSLSVTTPPTNSGERCGNLRVACVGDVHHAVHAIAVQLGVKGACDFTRSAREDDQAASGGDLFDRESVGREPRRDQRQLGSVNAELRSELGRRQPLRDTAASWDPAALPSGHRALPAARQKTGARAACGRDACLIRWRLRRIRRAPAVAHCLRA